MTVAGAGLSFTDHAIEQFVNRYAKNLKLREARTILEAVARNAIKTEEKTLRGDLMWLGLWNGREIRFVTKKDPIGWAVVTVLPEQVADDSDNELLKVLLQGIPPPSEEENEQSLRRKQETLLLAQKRSTGPPWLRELLADAYVSLGYRPGSVKRSLQEVLTEKEITEALERQKRLR